MTNKNEIKIKFPLFLLTGAIILDIMYASVMNEFDLELRFRGRDEAICLLCHSQIQSITIVCLFN